MAGDVHPEWIAETWDNITSRCDALPLTPAQETEIARRLDEHDADPDDVIPWETIKAEADKRLNGSASRRGRVIEYNLDGPGFPKPSRHEARMSATTVKEEVRRLADRLPDEATWEDVEYEIYVRRQIEAGLKDSREGRTIPHEEIRRRFGLSEQ